MGKLDTIMHIKSEHFGPPTKLWGYFFYSKILQQLFDERDNYLGLLLNSAHLIETMFGEFL